MRPEPNEKIHKQFSYIQTESNKLEDLPEKLSEEENDINENLIEFKQSTAMLQYSE